ncbi:MAG: HAD family hydrolase [Candidatus Riflebacteria bacterium]|jgi:heptosyltransferase-2|nr:HAD family hydrolase [Candidatus Riflebacteria bacterium]
MQKAIFLDRDGTLNPDPGYISNPDDFNIFPGVAEALVRLQQAGFMLILITNQSGISRGLISTAQLDKIHAKLQSQLAISGARLDAIYYCPHHPDFPDHAGISTCNCRKPAPGMILQAVREHNISVEKSFMIGDRSSDIKIGLATGVTPVFIGSKPLAGFETITTRPNLAAAADWILKQNK